jgi:DNA-binding NtrC family response regulator
MSDWPRVASSPSLSGTRRIAIPAISIVHGPGAVDPEEVARVARGVLGCDVVTIAEGDDDPAGAGSARVVDAHVVLGDAPRALERLLAARRPGVPVIVVGGAPRPEQRFDCWLPEGASPHVIASIVAQLARRAPSPRKRKSDMIVGRSAATEELLRTLDRVASTPAPVLITGESGTGKELVARAIHYSGPHAEAPFVPVNCAAIPESLFEAELFGHVRGAFTGAVAARPGVFEAADGGTLFLDEIGELPLKLQVKLLRVIETGQVTRLGTSEARRTRVRLLTATHRDLAQEVASGRFREDLYYRIRVLYVVVPPLRDRVEDVAPLVSHHLSAIAARDGRPVLTVTSAAMARLGAYTWPGNVRELVNCLERAVVNAPHGGPIDVDDVLLPGVDGRMPSNYRSARARFERRYYSQLLKAAGGNVSLAAKLAQRTRAQVYEALRRHELAPSGFRGHEGDDDERDDERDKDAAGQ